jgi:hypothetical protein
MKNDGPVGRGLLSVVQDLVPDDALLRTYQGGRRPECWAKSGDCFAITVDRSVTLAEFVFAFYTSPVFRIERQILRIFAGAPSLDSDALQLAEGTVSSFAIWRLGERTETQLLMCDRYERTRFWFRVVRLDAGKTLLQFGSAVASGDEMAQSKLRGSFLQLLLRLHVIYSHILLHAAKRGVMKKVIGTE